MKKTVAEPTGQIMLAHGHIVSKASSLKAVGNTTKHCRQRRRPEEPDTAPDPKPLTHVVRVPGCGPAVMGVKYH